MNQLHGNTLKNEGARKRRLQVCRNGKNSVLNSSHEIRRKRRKIDLENGHLTEEEKKELLKESLQKPTAKTNGNNDLHPLLPKLTTAKLKQIRRR